jgi:hypothetical protein
MKQLAFKARRSTREVDLVHTEYWWSVEVSGSEGTDMKGGCCRGEPRCRTLPQSRGVIGPPSHAQRHLQICRYAGTGSA